MMQHLVLKAWVRDATVDVLRQGCAVIPAPRLLQCIKVLDAKNGAVLLSDGQHTVVAFLGGSAREAVYATPRAPLEGAEDLLHAYLELSGWSFRSCVHRLDGVRYAWDSLAYAPEVVLYAPRARYLVGGRLQAKHGAGLVPLRDDAGVQTLLDTMCVVEQALALPGLPPSVRVGVPAVLAHGACVHELEGGGERDPGCDAEISRRFHAQLQPAHATAAAEAKAFDDDMYVARYGTLLLGATAPSQRGALSPIPPEQVLGGEQLTPVRLTPRRALRPAARGAGEHPPQRHESTRDAAHEGGGSALRSPALEVTSTPTRVVPPVHAVVRLSAGAASAKKRARGTEEDSDTPDGGRARTGGIAAAAGHIRRRGGEAVPTPAQDMATDVTPAGTDSQPPAITHSHVMNAVRAKLLAQLQERDGPPPPAPTTTGDADCASPHAPSSIPDDGTQRQSQPTLRVPDGSVRDGCNEHTSGEAGDAAGVESGHGHSAPSPTASAPEPPSLLSTASTQHVVPLSHTPASLPRGQPLTAAAGVSTEASGHASGWRYGGSRVPALGVGPGAGEADATAAILRALVAEVARGCT